MWNANLEYKNIVMIKIYSTKKPILSVLCTFFLFTGVNAQIPFSDGFESGDFITGGWTVTGNAQISTQFPSQGFYCVEGPTTWGISKTIGSIAVNTLFIEFDARASQINTHCMIFRIKDSINNTSAGIFFDDFGNIIGVDGSGAGSTISLMPYTTFTWYSFRFILDMTANKFDIYIDNILMADDFDFYSAGFTDPYLFTWSSLATSGSAWIDNVNIYTGTLGIDAEEAYHTVDFYPNPVQSLLYVKTEDADKYFVIIYNAFGQLLLDKKINAANPTVNLSGLQNGIYFAELRNHRSVLLLNKKLIKL